MKHLMPERPVWLYFKGAGKNRIKLTGSKQMTVRDNYDSGPPAVATELPNKLGASHFACFQKLMGIKG